MNAANWVGPDSHRRARPAPGHGEGARRMAKRKRLRTILLVEEENNERERLREILEAQGFRVLEASDFWTALQVHSQHPGRIDMLLTAIALSGNNGYELASAITGTDPRLKVLFASGPSGAEVSRFYNMPVNGPHLLNKPVGPDDLIARVNRAFGVRKRHYHVQRAR